MNPASITYREMCRVSVLNTFHLNGTPPLSNGNGNGNAFSNWLDIPNGELPPQTKDALERFYDVHRDFSITPTRATQQLMEKHKLIFRSYNHGFFLACRVEEKTDDQDQTFFTPFVPFDQAFSLRFTLLIKNPRVLNFTNVDASNIFYFTNLNRQEAPNSEVSLSNPIQVHSDLVGYKAGELVRNITGDRLFEALRDNTGTVLPEIVNLDWRRIPMANYASRADKLPVYPEIFSLNMESIVPEELSNVFEVEIQISKNGEIVYSAAITTENPATDPILEARVSLNEPNLLPGRYTLTLSFKNGNEEVIDNLSYSEVFYLDGHSFRQKAFGIIELFHPAPNSPGLIREDDSLYHPQFKIIFKNRSTKWRFHSIPVANIGNGSTEGENNDKTIIESEEPIPLTKANYYLGLDGNQVVPRPSLNLQLLPNPAIDHVHFDKEMKSWVSNIYFHLKPPNN